MPEPIAKDLRIEVRHVQFHSVITATIGPCKWVLKLPGKYRTDQALRLWEKERARFTLCQ
jgi:hypothetical protein